MDIPDAPRASTGEVLIVLMALTDRTWTASQASHERPVRGRSLRSAGGPNRTRGSSVSEPDKSSHQYGEGFDAEEPVAIA